MSTISLSREFGFQSMANWSLCPMEVDREGVQVENALSASTLEGYPPELVLCRGSGHQNYQRQWATGPLHKISYGGAELAAFKGLGVPALQSSLTYCGWTKSCTTSETLGRRLPCRYQHGFRVVQDFVHQQYDDVLLPSHFTGQPN